MKAGQYTAIRRLAAMVACVLAMIWVSPAAEAITQEEVITLTKLGIAPNEIIKAIEKDKTIFDLTASFHTPEVGPGVISPSPPQHMEEPENLPTFEECMAEVGPIFGDEWSKGPRPVEYRIEHAPWSPTGPSETGGINFWFRARRALSDQPEIHAAILAYMSDDCVADTLLVPYGRSWGTEGTMLVSLDHAMWFHTEARADEWVYVEQWPVEASGARGLAESRMWQDDRLIASVAQEALTRF